MADPVLSAKIAALESQMNSLKLQLRGSPGVSTNSAGAMSIRTTQLGFAAELTSSYDPSTGYSWKRLRLEPPSLLDPDIQPTGENAFEVTGDESLESGAKVWIEPSPDAVGYLFTVGAGAEPAGDSSCKSFLALPECATLEVTEAYGACACITTGQTASLTRSGDALASDDPLYGCPPGVTTATGCTDNEAASKFSFTIPTQVDGCTGAGGGWTVTYSALNTWTATRGSFTATLTKSIGPAAELIITDGGDNQMIWIGEFDCCTGGTLDIDSSSGDCSAPSTLTLTPATACGNGPAYTPYLSLETDTCGDCLKLLWIPVAGSGAASIRWKLIGCGVDGNGKPYAEFASASPLICTDDSEECGENYVVVRVTCEPCDGGTVTISCGGVDYEFASIMCALGSPGASVGTPSLTIEHTAGGTWYGEGYVGSFFYEITLDIECVGDELVSSGSIDTYDFARESLICSRTFSSQPVSTSSPYVATVVDATGEFCSLYGYLYVSFSAGLTCPPDNGESDCGFEADTTATLTLTGGSYAGEYTSTWADDGYTLSAGPFTVSGMGSPVVNLYVYFTGGTWYILCLVDGGYEYYRNASSVSPSVEFITDDLAALLDSATSVSLGDCALATTYNCVNGTCVEVYDGSGEFPTLGECEAACAGGGGGGEPPCTGDVGQTATMVIPDGDYAGTYYGAWTLLGGYPYVYFGTSPYPVVVYYNPSPPDPLTPGYLLGTLGEGSPCEDGVNAESEECGPPSILVFPGDCLGSTGDITVTT